MRFLNVILLVFLICKSSMAMGLVSILSINQDGNCCNSKEVIEVSCQVDDTLNTDESSEKENKGCCSNGVCDCICCGHVFVGKIAEKIQANGIIKIIQHNHIFKNNYIFNSSNLIWQPPRLN